MAGLFPGVEARFQDVVDLTEPHFIRCIKPNPQNVPDLFDRKGVTEQLRYGGVLQVVQVSRAGYPVRINHQEMGSSECGAAVEECWDDYKIVGSTKVVSELRHIQAGLSFASLSGFKRC